MKSTAPPTASLENEGPDAADTARGSDHQEMP
jgi:hypothetical protein